MSKVSVEGRYATAIPAVAIRAVGEILIDWAERKRCAAPKGQNYYPIISSWVSGGTSMAERHNTVTDALAEP